MVSASGVFLLSPVRGATVIDWLDLGAGGTPAAFSLVTDSGVAVSSGQLVIDSGKGIPFPGLPANSSINGSFWSAATGFANSNDGTEKVDSMDFRVVPQTGMASFSIQFLIPSNQEVILTVGGLYRDNINATQTVLVTTASASVSLIQTVGWDSGTSAYDQDLEWNSVSQVLSTTAGSVGDSEIAFFRIQPTSGSGSMVNLTIPSGYGVGTGDSISIGLGIVIPEPGVIGLLGFSGLFFLAARRR